MRYWTLVWGVFAGALTGLSLAGPVYLLGCIVTGFPADASLPIWAVLCWPIFPLAGAIGGGAIGRKAA